MPRTSKVLAALDDAEAEADAKLAALEAERQVIRNLRRKLLEAPASKRKAKSPPPAPLTQ